VVKPEGNSPLGRPRRRWENDKKAIREIGWCDKDCIYLAQDRNKFVGSC
jgi:hypothetical protein